MQHDDDSKVGFGCYSIDILRLFDSLLSNRVKQSTSRF
ncbi:hypothetical protein APA_411 [Pseudanabaena sp. lw0831]|nr:hypothetical protein APA_411 [Pseudanabaena sp. lw0831]